MRSVIEGWVGTDADLLTELNRPQHKRVIGDGMVTLAMVGSLNVELAAGVNLTLETILAAMPEANVTEKAQKSMLKRFLERFTVSDRGLDFSNDEVRDQMTGLLTLGGFTTAQITALLGLGAVYESDAHRALQRDATQDDVDAVRSVIVREAMQSQWSGLLSGTIQPALETGTLSDIVAAIRSAADAMEGV